MQNTTGLFRVTIQLRMLSYHFNLSLEIYCLEHLDKPPSDGYVITSKMAFIQPILLETPTYLRYAPKALPTDPASRLMILADTDNGDGTRKLRCLFTQSTKVVEKLNRLVDFLRHKL